MENSVHIPILNSQHQLSWSPSSWFSTDQAAPSWVTNKLQSLTAGFFSHNSKESIWTDLSIPKLKLTDLQHACSCITYLQAIFFLRITSRLRPKSRLHRVPSRADHVVGPGHHPQPQGLHELWQHWLVHELAHCLSWCDMPKNSQRRFSINYNSVGKWSAYRINL